MVFVVTTAGCGCLNVNAHEFCALCPTVMLVTHQRVKSRSSCTAQAWRAVDRAYVDKTFNGQSWFKVRSGFSGQHDLPCSSLQP